MRRGLGDQVARGARDLGDDGAVLLQQAVEQAALADVGAADDGERESLRAPGCRRRKLAASVRDAASIGREPAQDLRGGRDADVVFGEIDAGFEQRDQLQQLLLERRDAAGDGALHLLRGDARLVERGGVDQVADGLGLRQVDAAVEEGAQGELAGLGEARAGFAARARRRAAARPASRGRRSRRRLRRCRSAGCSKKVTTTWSTVWPSRVEQLARVRAPGMPVGDAGSEDALGDGARVAAGEAHDAEAAAARRSGDGDDGVVRVASGVTARTRPPRSRPPRRRPPPRRRSPRAAAVAVIAGADRRYGAARRVGCGGGSGRLAMPAG